MLKSLFSDIAGKKKRPPAQVFSCEFCEIFKNIFFAENLWATAFSILTASRQQT